MPACSAAQAQGAFSRSLFSRESNVGGTNLRVLTFCDDKKLLDGPWLASWCTTSDPSVLPLASFVWNDVAHFSGVYHWLKFIDRLFELCAVVLVLVSILVLFEFELICDASHICDRASSHVLDGLFLAKGDILSARGASSGDKVRKDDVASDSPARKLFDGTIMSLLSDVLDRSIHGDKSANFAGILIFLAIHLATKQAARLPPAESPIKKVVPGC